MMLRCGCELQLAYEYALTRPETLGRYKYVAIDYIRGESVVMGDTHTPARNRMQQLIVAPGNAGYLNSYRMLGKQKKPIYREGDALRLPLQARAHGNSLPLRKSMDSISVGPETK